MSAHLLLIRERCHENKAIFRKLWHSTIVIGRCCHSMGWRTRAVIRVKSRPATHGLLSKMVIELFFLRTCKKNILSPHLMNIFCLKWTSSKTEGNTKDSDMMESLRILHWKTEKNIIRTSQYWKVDFTPTPLPWWLFAKYLFKSSC